jgi:pimeloyl-ACP methyl ester carboxylesterase
LATYVLIHGAGGSAWEWGHVADELLRRGHDPVAVDLPCEDETAGWSEYADAVVDAVGERTDLVVVAHSLGGFTAPLVCARTGVDLLVLLAAMVPSPGETGRDWWLKTGYEEAVRGHDHNESEIAVFYHDVPWELAAEAVTKWRSQAETPMLEPWPLERWPDVPTKYVLCRDDRMFPADWIRRVVWERLGVMADELDGGHCPFLSRPRELVARLEAYRAGLEQHRAGHLSGWSTSSR